MLGVAAIAGIGIGVRQQATALAQTQHATMQGAYLSSKEVELRHYVELATSAIAPLYDASRDASEEAAARGAGIANAPAIVPAVQTHSHTRTAPAAYPPT